MTRLLLAAAAALVLTTVASGQTTPCVHSTARSVCQTTPPPPPHCDRATARSLGCRPSPGSPAAKPKPVPAGGKDVKYQTVSREGYKAKQEVE